MGKGAEIEFLEVVFLDCIIQKMSKDVIDSINKQIEKGDDLLKKRSIAGWKSRRATNITLLDNLFGKNNEYSREFQKMTNGFMLAAHWVPNTFDYQDYDSYITIWKMILWNALDLYNKIGKSIKGNDAKYSIKKWQTINVKNTNILSQTQITNINIDNILKNELRWKEYIQLNKILQEKTKKTKWEKILEFLKDLWSETLAKIIKDILLWN